MMDRVVTKRSWSPVKGMDEYLHSNELVIINQKIVEKTRDVIKGTKTAREAALKIFYYIRNARFVFGPPSIRSSVEVLDRFDRGKPDHCIGKAVLQAAMLRAANIPVRFRFLKFPMTGWLDKEIFMGRAKGSVSCHPYVEAYLSGRWIACDATVDPSLREPFICNEWDGESSVKLRLPDVKSVDSAYASPNLPYEEIKDLIARYKQVFPFPLRPFAFKIGELIIGRAMNKFR